MVEPQESNYCNEGKRPDENVANLKQALIGAILVKANMSIAPVHV